MSRTLGYGLAGAISWASRRAGVENRFERPPYTRPMSTDASPPRPRVVVLLGHDQDPVRWRERHAAGETLDETPYGYDLASEWCEIGWARSHSEHPVVARVRRRV